MSRIPLTSDWAWRLPQGPFAAAQGASVTPTPVTLPHDALRDADRSPDAPGKGAMAFYPPGAYTYLRTLTAEESWADKAVLLEFQGAMRHAMVYVNDEFAGNRSDGYARFFVDIKPFLRLGADNQIRVEVRTGEDSRWYSGAGLHRPVFLHVLDPVHVVPDGVRVTTLWVADGQAQIEVAATVANDGPVTVTEKIGISIDGPDGDTVEIGGAPVTLAPGDSAVLRQRLLILEPALWSPESPDLYRVWVSCGEQLVEETFGIRTIRCDPRYGLRLNGERVLLRGACIHHDNGPLGGAALDRAEERRIELLKAAGFNAIRAAHNPLSVAMLDACDRVGMLVMDEAFDQWHRGKTPYDAALEFEQWWAADLDSLVAKDYNHPSVILYSIGNEIAEVGTPLGSRWARRLAEHVRTQDPTRLITNGVNAALAVLDELPAMMAEAEGGLNEMMSDAADAMNALGSSDPATQRIEESSSVLDVLGLNYAQGRYVPDQTAFPHRVIVGSETFGSMIGQLWPMVVELPHVIGDFTWTGWDYLGEVGIGSTAYAEDPDAVPALEREFPFLTADCADLDITGFRRPLSYYREIVFGLRSEPYLAVLRPEHHGHTVTMASPWSWSDAVSSWTWPGFEGRPVTVEVYADADAVTLLCDGEQVGAGTPDAKRPMVFSVETTYQPGRLEAVAWRDGAEVGRSALVTAGTPRLTATTDRTQLRPDGTDAAFIAIELADADGVLDPTASASVQVEVEGAGVLAGFCSANPKTVERFDADVRTTFDGRALAVVRPLSEGSITVTVSAAGFESVSVSVTLVAG